MTTFINEVKNKIDSLGSQIYDRLQKEVFKAYQNYLDDTTFQFAEETYHDFNLLPSNNPADRYAKANLLNTILDRDIKSRIDTSFKVNIITRAGTKQVELEPLKEVSKQLVNDFIRNGKSKYTEVIRNLLLGRNFSDKTVEFLRVNIDKFEKYFRKEQELNELIERAINTKKVKNQDEAKLAEFFKEAFLNEATRAIKDIIYTNKTLELLREAGEVLDLLKENDKGDYTMKQWLDDFTQEHNIDLNDTLDYKGVKRTIGEVYDYVLNQDEKLQNKFRDSLEKGAEAGKIKSYMFNASKYYKFDAETEKKTTTRKVSEPVTKPKNKGKINEEMEAWLTQYATDYSLNLNDKFQYKNKAGEVTAEKSIREIFDFVVRQDEKTQAKFRDSLEKGAEAENIKGFMFMATRGFKFDEAIQKKTSFKAKDTTREFESLEGKSYKELKEELKQQKQENASKKKFVEHSVKNSDEMKIWLNNFVRKNSININDIFNFSDKDGTKRAITIKQIMHYVADADKKTQDKFKKSLTAGADADNIYGYMYNASRYFKIAELAETKERANEKNESYFKKQEQIVEMVTNSFDKMEEQLKNPDPKIVAKAIGQYNEFVTQFGELYNYSYNNNMLIFGQQKNRGMSLSGVIKSEKDWNELEVEITNKDPLMIYVPVKTLKWEMESFTMPNGREGARYKLDDEGNKIPVLNEKGEQEETLSFRLSGKVYAVGQTNAFEKGFMKPDTKLGTTAEINITERFYNKIKDEISSKFDVDIYDNKILQGIENGYYTFKNSRNQIHIDSGLKLESKLGVLLHEAGHRILHYDRNNRGSDDFSKAKREAEAESFAYVVGKQLGLEQPSALYIGDYINKFEEAKLSNVLYDVYNAVKGFNNKIDVETLVNNEKEIQAEINKVEQGLEELKDMDTSSLDAIKAEINSKENKVVETTKEVETNRNKNKQRP